MKLQLHTSAGTIYPIQYDTEPLPELVAATGIGPEVRYFVQVEGETYREVNGIATLDASRVATSPAGETGTMGDYDEQWQSMKEHKQLDSGYSPKRR